MAQNYPSTTQSEKPPPYLSYSEPPPMGFVEATTTTVITNEPTPQAVIATSPIIQTHFPQRVNCPSCRANVTTVVASESGAMTHIIAFVLCIFGCWPCCLIPYCVDGCKDTLHSCPNCNNQIAFAKRL